MRALTTDEINDALGRLKDGLERYIWLQHHVGLCDVGMDEQFQRRFNGFYRVRRDLSWRSDYFALMESAKETGIEFSEALKEIYRRTGRIEASFTSKLVATLNPSTPVIDRFVLNNFELKLPRWGLPDRESKTIDLYRAELKKIDLVLWKIRP